MTIARREVMFGGAAIAAAAPATGQPRRRDGFLWGAATAAHQIEGGNVNNDYWVLEHLPGTYFREPSGDACDSWNRWREDLALVRLAGLNCYRFSIEWARVEPAPGEFSAAALDRYRAMCAEARASGVEPMVTFQHFTAPRWIAAAGGWENPSTADRFARFCDRAARALGDGFGWACTINEANAPINTKILQRQPWAGEAAFRAEGARRVGSDRFQTFFLGDCFRSRDVILSAHAKGHDAIKAAAPHVRVGMTLAIQQLAAGPGGEALYRRLFDEARAPFYAAAARDDFVGVQTYYDFRTGPDGYAPAPPGGDKDMFDQPTPPAALGVTIREVHGHARVPVVVTENGLATTDDAWRIRHLRGAVDSMAAAIASGIPVLGYLHWTLLDNFEWATGYRAKFGLVAVDRSTFRRTPKPSFAAYRALVATMRRNNSWA